MSIPPKKSANVIDTTTRLMIMITFEAYFFLDNEGMILWSLLYSKFLANLLYFWMTRLPALIWRTGGAKWWSYLEDLLRDHRNGGRRIFVLRIWGKLDSDMNSFLKDGWAVSIFENEGLSFIASSISGCEKLNGCCLLAMSPWMSYWVTWKRILSKSNRVRERVSTLIFLNSLWHILKVLQLSLHLKKI